MSAQAGVQTVMFDYSRAVIALDVSVAGSPLVMLLDTGVDPSVIDLKAATALNLPLDRKGGGEVDGTGQASSAVAYPSRIEKLSIDGVAYPGVEALATDMATLSTHFGSKLDGVLGFSFLVDKVVLIDYPARTVTFASDVTSVAPRTSSCARRFEVPMKFMKDDNTPLIPEFRFGDVTGPATLDTGSNDSVSMFGAALDLPNVRKALVDQGEMSFAGARGKGTAHTYRIDEPIGFGPFTLASGQSVSVRSDKGSPDTRVANVGNRVFAQLGLRLLLDYPGKRIGFFGDCR